MKSMTPEDALVQKAEELSIRCRDEDRDLTDAEKAELDQLVDNYYAAKRKIGAVVRRKLTTLRDGIFNKLHKRKMAVNLTDEATDQSAVTTIAGLNDQVTERTLVI